MPTGMLATPRDMTCPMCGKAFTAYSHSQKYCRHRCTVKASKLRLFGTNDVSRDSPVNGSPIGASAEMLVCFDLLRHGLEPYLPVNGHAHHDILCGTKDASKL